MFAGRQALQRVGHTLLRGTWTGGLRTVIPANNAVIFQQEQRVGLSTSTINKCPLGGSSFSRNPSCSSISLSKLFQDKLNLVSSGQEFSTTSKSYASLEYMHKHWGGPHKKFRPPRKPLDGNPFMKGVVLKTLIKKPKKPNSANRKCVLVRLSNGREAVAYVPGIGHNLQEHNVVLVRCGRLQDVPGVKLKCVRGVYDLPHVQKQTQAHG